MEHTTVPLANDKSLRLFESSCIEPSVWIELYYNDDERGFALCDVEAARELIAALNTFVEENS